MKRRTDEMARRTAGYVEQERIGEQAPGFMLLRQLKKRAIQLTD
jgi:hypothetical protein